VGIVHQHVKRKVRKGDFMAKLRVYLLVVGAAVGFACSVGIACAETVTGYVNNPTGNSGDFAAGVLALGGTLNTSINFDTHPVGPLQGNFYSGLGVTLSGTGDFTSVQFGAGPADGNIFSTPLSPGEGPHAPSNFVGTSGLGIVQDGTFTTSFNTPVLGAGLFLIDLFNPGGADPATIQAFTGQNGTGTSLGTFTAAPFNFQNNNLYFMGITSSGADIGSLVFTGLGSSTGDHIGLDNVEFALPTSSTVPEPSSLALLGTGLLALVGFVRRKAIA
jgi:hypothetical protein